MPTPSNGTQQIASSTENDYHAEPAPTATKMTTATTSDDNPDTDARASLAMASCSLASLTTTAFSISPSHRRRSPPVCEGAECKPPGDLAGQRRRPVEHVHVVLAAAWRRRRGDGVVEPTLRRVVDDRLVVVSTGGKDWTHPDTVATPVDGGWRVAVDRMIRDLGAATYHPYPPEEALALAGRATLGLDPIGGRPCHSCPHAHPACLPAQQSPRAQCWPGQRVLSSAAQEPPAPVVAAPLTDRHEFTDDVTMQIRIQPG